MKATSLAVTVPIHSFCWLNLFPSLIHSLDLQGVYPPGLKGGRSSFRLFRDIPDADGDVVARHYPLTLGLADPQ